MQIRAEVIPFILVSLAIGILILAFLRWRRRSWRKSVCYSSIVTIILCGYLAFFFRDPNRISPQGNNIIVSGADGAIASITNMYEASSLKTNCVRVSIFLSLFNVHVNRAPIAGESTFLGYFPGKRFFTFQEKSSHFNQHNKILIRGEQTHCLVKQIVGPVCRRVVYWPDHDNPVQLALGERIGMMKFGSRLDMYFPESDIVVEVKKGDKVKAGETIIGHIKPNTSAQTHATQEE